MTDERLYTVTELATELGITARAIRFYEDKGLIIPSRVGSTRVYSYRERARMRLILRGKSLGFSLREIKDFLDLYNVDPMHRVQHEALLAAVRDRMGKLERMQATIAHTLEELQAIEEQTVMLLEAPRIPGQDEVPLKIQPKVRA
ncbi:MerR family DNA-binding transcriptional regulator [Acetobacteraceae bacterium KSS8]|uniref:MerR family DNA-binding transcriptional regulator n=1 Tax=Endosaccharibacter trunci TaxID=2812733 RepID=A0ABT1WA89_9PROT|nr:MerR family DNA-binding transcriptional regulator [Acetobacteraceae bacterium KSS8]